ncbi:hypothetical protein PF005_g9552 [Phytophthora fragariae]|uniref:Secreted protein n=1 Tax=Phytophthora fragariae TaxID=53985 RepID=A0A6A3PW56_9STRA|nr:hypothetical protein PF003_g18420 [Phytophthora fragariae]KAE8944607.1 hypothetical protein PF009_g5704 [Phytophthora fragariae]KAE8976151.1 hypothetical protein PF011_g24170 [Phytophthora fragariae]KAE9061065.1 hypothetical protein PF007_g30388 [Phytophthora fragariae]KAE9073881.1 hypothetical protein PF010_g24896 [Phytophthora fragariae]
MTPGLDLSFGPLFCVHVLVLHCTTQAKVLDSSESSYVLYASSTAKDEIDNASSKNKYVHCLR